MTHYPSRPKNALARHPRYLGANDPSMNQNPAIRTNQNTTTPQITGIPSQPRRPSKYISGAIGKASTTSKTATILSETVSLCFRLPFGLSLIGIRCLLFAFYRLSAERAEVVGEIFPGKDLAAEFGIRAAGLDGVVEFLR